MEIDVWVPLPVVAKQRARLTRRRRGRRNVAYTPQATRNFESQVGELVRDALPANQSFGSQPVCVTLEIHKEGFRLVVETAECSVRPIGVRGDLDNYVKSILDGLNGVLWKDDRQVELLTVAFVGVPRKGTFHVEDEE